MADEAVQREQEDPRCIAPCDLLARRHLVEGHLSSTVRFSSASASSNSSRCDSVDAVDVDHEPFRTSSACGMNDVAAEAEKFRVVAVIADSACIITVRVLIVHLDVDRDADVGEVRLIASQVGRSPGRSVGVDRELELATSLDRFPPSRTQPASSRSSAARSGS